MEYRLQEPCKRKTRPQAENKQPQMNMDTIQETGLGNTVGDDTVELNPSVINPKASLKKEGDEHKDNEES